MPIGSHVIGRRKMTLSRPNVFGPLDRLVMAFAAAGALVTSSPAAADQPIAQFRPGTANGQSAIDHAPLREFLKRLGVEEEGRLKIAFSASGARGADYLDAYVAGLSKISPQSLGGDEQLAYWLNMRNAMILSELSRRGGRGSLKKVRGDFIAPGEGWTVKRATVDGVALSIDDIERRIILANWRDPRVLYGLYQASASGPALTEEPFSGVEVWNKLEAAGRDFVRSSAVRVRKGRLEASAIYEWCREALFTGQDQAIINHVASLAPAGKREEYAAAEGVSFSAFRYRIESFEPRSVAPLISSAPGGTGSFPTGS